MPKLKKILVPVDHSDCSRVAMEYAMLLAEPFGAKIDVLHVAETPPYVGEDRTVVNPATGEPQLLSELLMQQAVKAETEFLAPFVRDARIPIERSLLTGRPSNVIVEEAAKRGADLIVMGTHGLSGFQRLIIGSVTERVLRSAPCPVVVVRHPDDES
jgi:nucleotide-binding universal stress UspA family protein